MPHTMITISNSIVIILLVRKYFMILLSMKLYLIGQYKIIYDLLQN